MAVGDPLERIEDSTVGAVSIHSGKDGSPLYTILGEDDKEQYGKALCDLSDIDKDGIRDFVAAGGGGHRGGIARINIHSGRNGAILRSIDHGVSESEVVLAAGPDLDKDNTADLLIGFPEYDDFGSDRGAVYCVSTGTGIIIKRILGANSGDFFGSKVAIGNLTLDNKPDLLIGAHRGNLPRQSYSERSGVVYAYDGVSGALLYEVAGERAWDCFGYSLEVLGDINNDNQDDFGVGAPGNYPRLCANRDDILNYGYVRIYSGRDGEQISQIGGWEILQKIKPEYRIDERYNTYRAFGYSLKSANLDEKRGTDLIIGVYGWGGVVVGVSSVDNEVLFVFEESKYNIGGACAALGDANEDGIGDIAIGDVERSYFKQDTDEDGRVIMISGSDGALLLEISNP